MRKNYKYYLAGSVALITFLVYLTALRNDFVNWDDDIYVYENPHIRILNPAFFKWAFLNFHASYWSPLTWISHALDYAVWGLNPLGHHLTNNILHAANTFLVVFLVIRLLEAWKGRTTQSELSPFVHERTMLIAAGTTGLLFGLHPVHVESVAWVAERKDLLCALFFLLSIIGYTNYACEAEPVKNNRTPRFFNKYYLVTIGFFILALLSKPMAVTLPVVLLVLDWYPFNRLRSSRAFRFALIEKLPFFALSLISSMLTVLAANKGGAMELMETVSLSTRVLVGFRSLAAYLGKMLWPLNLVPYYPYPKDASPLSLEYFSAIVLVIGVTAACVVMAKKQKLWLTAWGYYVVTLVPVLGIVQVGGQAMADRFTYLPSLSPFFVMGLVVASGAEKLKKFEKRGLIHTVFVAAAAIFVLASLSYLTVKQIGVWRDSLELWSCVIEKEPQKSPRAYDNRGQAYETRGQFDKAIQDYTSAISLNPSSSKAFFHRAMAFEKTARIEDAITDYSTAISLNPSFAEAYNNRGIVFEQSGQLDKALADYNMSISLNQSNLDAYNNRGIVYEKTGKLDKAIADYTTAIRLDPRYQRAYFNRGLAFEKAGQFDKAIKDYNTAIAIDSKYVDAYSNRGLVYFHIGQIDRALRDFNNAILLDKNNVTAYLNRGKLYLKTGERGRAIEDFQYACRLGNSDGCSALH